MDKIHSFYTSRSWKDFSYRLKIERGGKCERCGWTAVTKEDWKYLIGHHKVELTEQNINDPSITLNPDLTEVICLNCHNEDHHRFGNAKSVYIVWGSPLSGKTTMVQQVMQYGDIVLDVDTLWQAITMQPLYTKPKPCRFNVFKLRDSLLDQIKTRYGSWYTAWVIGGYPDKYERERISQALGAECIYCESTKAECLKRREESGKPIVWDEYIIKWWEEFERTGQ